MWSIYKRELSAFFSSLIAYMVLGIFLLTLGLFTWVFSETSILSYNYASLDQLFTIAPMIFIFLIPAITMRSFAEERQTGTIELIGTKPVSDTAVVLGKYLANLTLVLMALIPTLIYFYSVYMIGSPKGNMDIGGTIGSYVGLLLLSGSFVAVGVFGSSLTQNQIVSFVLGTFLCFVLFWAFYYLSRLPIFIGRLDNIIEKIGMSFHYDSVSRGVIDTRDLVYFFSIIFFFLSATVAALKLSKK